jgi:hypothetical protein
LPDGSAKVRGKRTVIRVGYIAGLLFAVHPIHVEAVANIVGRAELMCALGTMGALMLLAHRPLTSARSVAISACAILAVLSKEQGLLVPLLLLALGFAMRFRSSDAKERTALRTLVLLICWSTRGYVLFREWILRFSWERSLARLDDQPADPLDRHQSLATPGFPSSVAIRRLLIAPIHLSPDYGGAVIGWTVQPNDPYLYLGFAALLAWIACAFAALRARARGAGFALVGLALTYGMISNIVTLIGTNFGERLMYLPSTFFIILRGAAVDALTTIPPADDCCDRPRCRIRSNDRLRAPLERSPGLLPVGSAAAAEVHSSADADHCRADEPRAPGRCRRRGSASEAAPAAIPRDLDPERGRGLGSGTLGRGRNLLKHAIRIAPRSMTINRRRDDWSCSTRSAPLARLATYDSALIVPARRRTASPPGNCTSGGR